MPEVSPDTIIDGRYKVSSRLGTGGMADVFLAEDQQLGRKVALKLLHRRFAEDPGFVERFRREAQAAAGLQHPNVVSVYDRGAYDGTYYIAMEYLPGRTLKQLIRDDAPLDPVRAIDITIQILKASRFAHRRGVIHRDLKPHNVIVDDGDHAKVTDFGIARAGASDMTETGSIMGTAQYLSPEQAQGHAVSASSDLYSVAVVLYEMVTGRVPFDAEAAVTIALKHVSEAPANPSTLNPNLPPELEQVVLWALNKNPADRPADADQFVAALEQARAAIVARGAGQRTASMAAVAATAAVIGGGPPAATDGANVAAEGLPPSPEDGQQPPDGGTGPPGPETPRKRRRLSPWVWAGLLALLIAGGAAAAYLLTRPATKLVPTVVGEQVSVAQAQVQNAGFTPNLIYRADTHPTGSVIGQNPLGGVKADVGSTVTLTVSQGPGNVTVPSVADLSQAAAVQAIKGAGLNVSRVRSDSSDTVPSGTAIRTEPAAGLSVPKGSGVTLFVSSGRAQVTVPDVTGQTEAAAKATLVNAGFKVSTSTAPSSTAPPGTVTGQSPSGNSQAPFGSAVAIVLATKAQPTTAKIPGVVGQSANAASGALTAAGFTVRTKTVSTTDKTQDGNVISQTPGANSTANKGSTVTITVGKLKTPTTTTTTSPTTSTTSSHT